MTLESNYSLISIIVPVFNHAAYVEDCLNSILADDYPNKEIIILNDGSTDSSAEIIRSWISKHAVSGNTINIMFLDQANKGICFGLNKMIAQSQGEYIRPLAGDDRLIPGMLKKHYLFLKSHPNKSIALADSQVVDDSGKVLKNSTLTEYLGHQKSTLLNENSLKRAIILKGKIIPNVIVKKSFYIGFQYPLELIMEDNYFFLFAIATKQLVFYDAVVADYRVHGANSSYKFFLNEPQERTEKRVKINLSLIQSYKKVNEHFSGFNKVLVKYALIKIWIKVLILKILFFIKKI